MTAAPAPPLLDTARGRPFRVCLCFTACLLVVLTAPAALAEECGALDEDMRWAIKRTVHRHLLHIDDDQRRWRHSFGDGVVRNGAYALASHASGGRRHCIPDSDERRDLTEISFGAEAHAGIGDLGVRALVLRSTMSDGDGPGEMVHDAYGGFIGYGEWAEVGLVRTHLAEATLPGDGSGWLVSAASHGVRVTMQVGDDEVDDVELRVGTLSFGPLDLAVGGRYLTTAGLPTIYVDIERLVLSGDRLRGAHAQVYGEFEPTTGQLRAGYAHLELTTDWLESIQAPSPARSQGDPPDPSARIPYRIQLSGWLAGSFARASMTPEGRLTLGGGLGSSMGVYGRKAGLVLVTQMLLNDPRGGQAFNEESSPVDMRAMAHFKVGLGR